MIGLLYLNTFVKQVYVVLDGRGVFSLVLVQVSSRENGCYGRWRGQKAVTKSSW